LLALFKSLYRSFMCLNNRVNLENIHNFVPFLYVIYSELVQHTTLKIYHIFAIP
jgi:hypothetical protein